MFNWLKWVLLGVLSILFGIFALNHAVLTSLSVTLVVGGLLLLSGAVQIVAGVREARTASKILTILLGAMLVLLGLSFLIDPLSGTISLALLTTIFIAAGGLLRLYYAFRLRGTSFFWLMMVPGVLSLLLAIYILANPAITVALLGVLLGVELIFNGLGLVVLGLYRRGNPQARAA